MLDPFDVLKRAIKAKSDLQLVQVMVTAVGASTATVTYRGSSVAGVRWTGSAPTDDALCWALVDVSRIVLLT